MANYNNHRAWLRAQLTTYTETMTGGLNSALTGMASLIPEVGYDSANKAIVISYPVGGEN